MKKSGNDSTPATGERLYLRLIDHDQDVIDALRKKLRLKDAQILRLGLHELARKEGVTVS